MNFWQAIASGFTQYVTFGGRASRSEFWYWFLFSLLGGLVTEMLEFGIFRYVHSFGFTAQRHLQSHIISAEPRDRSPPFA